jgi:Uma2 family endonuclease
MTLTEAQSFETPSVHRFTRAEYYQMAEMGFFDGKRVERVEGEIIDMAPQKNPHALAVSRTMVALLKAFGEQFWIRTQATLSLGQDSDPEPDLAVVPGRMEDHLGEQSNPTTAILIVEVSDTTLHFDRGRKASIYARAGISDYWILNLRDRCLEVMRNAVEDASALGGFRYQSVTTLRPPARVIPLSCPTASIPIADLLP